jgi:protein TonB
MAPSIHIEVPPESKAKTKPAEKTVLEPRAASTAATAGAVKVAHIPEEGSFQSSMLEYNRMKSGSKFMNMLISLTVNCTIVIIPIFLALYFTDTLDLRQFASTFLVAPPPPPPPPPPPAVVQVVRVKPMAKLMEAGKLVAPRVIPKEIKIIKEDPMAPDVGGVAGGVPGGVAGGSMGGVIGGVIGGVSTVAPLAPKREGPKAPVRVGGRVKEPRLISRVDPIYPPLAKQTHLQGSVVIDAIIDEHGQIMEVKVISGPPLLIQAAMDAVRKWRYEPTYLNEEPVPVQLNVTVTFRLNE